jgi:hypothetical protein
MKAPATDERSIVWWQSEALRLQRALDAVLPASYDPLPADESEVDAFIARRTEEWREGLASRLERIFMRHDRRERVVRALENKGQVDDDDDPGEP